MSKRGCCSVGTSVALWPAKSWLILGLSALMGPIPCLGGTPAVSLPVALSSPTSAPQGMMIADVMPAVQTLDCRVDQLLHGAHPPAESAMAREVLQIHQQHSCLPFLAGSKPYLR